MSQPLFFEDSTVDSSAWKTVEFGLTTKNQIIISADQTNTDDIYFTFDATAPSGSPVTMGRIMRGEPLNLAGKRNKRIFLKAKSGTQSYRVWGY